MGCGKSSVGRKLSQLLCCPFMDLDSVIEERTGRSIPDIFANDGEAVFRQMELDTLKNILEEVGRQSAPPAPSHFVGPGRSCCRRLLAAKVHRTICPVAHDPYAGVRECQFRTSASQPISTQIVLSLGGGTVMTPECAELVRENTTCIYLRASVDTLASRLVSEAEGRPLLNPASHPESTDSNNSLNVSAADLRSRIESLMSRRASTYEDTAHITIDTDSLSVDEIAQTLAEKISPIR